MNMSSTFLSRSLPRTKRGRLCPMLRSGSTCVLSSIHLSMFFDEGWCDHQWVRSILWWSSSLLSLLIRQRNFHMKISFHVCCRCIYMSQKSASGHLLTSMTMVVAPFKVNVSPRHIKIYTDVSGKDPDTPVLDITHWRRIAIGHSPNFDLLPQGVDPDPMAKPYPFYDGNSHFG